MKNEFDRARQRTLQYWFIDGLIELSFGALCLLLALYFWLGLIIPSGSLLAGLVNLSLIFIIIGGSLLARRATRALKERLTYPRTGYIAYRQPMGRDRWIRIGLAIGVAVIIAFLAASSILPPLWMPGISGLIFGIVWIVIAFRSGLLRIYLIAALSLVVGIGLSLAGIGDVQGLVVFYGFIGLGLSISGGLTLRNYLKSTAGFKNTSQAEFEEHDDGGGGP